MSTARRLCPQAVIIDGRHGRYAEVSERVMAIFARFTPLVEPLSLDEAFLDVSGAGRSIGDGPAIAAMIRHAVRSEEGLECSVGVAPSKFLAKLATETAKPTPTPTGPRPGIGVAVVEPDRIEEFLEPLAIGALWGVGPATHTKLSRLGIRTVGDCARLDLGALQLAVGDAHGRHIHDLCRGIDDRPVVADRAPKSISHEQTFAVDLRDADTLDLELARLAQGVSIRLRHAELSARVVTLKVRDPDFVTVTRSRTTDVPVEDNLSLLAAARALFSSLDVSGGVRLLGISAGGLGAVGEPRQMTFDLSSAPAGTTAAPSAASSAAGAAVDRIRDRFGDGAIGSARLATRSAGQGASRVSGHGGLQHESVPSISWRSVDAARCRCGSAVRTWTPQATTRCVSSHDRRGGERCRSPRMNNGSSPRSSSSSTRPTPSWHIRSPRRHRTPSRPGRFVGRQSASS